MRKHLKTLRSMLEQGGAVARFLRLFPTGVKRMNVSEIEASDVLNGYGEIAIFLRITVPQAKHRAAIGSIPIFKVGRAVSARKSSILAAIAQAENKRL